MPTVSFNTHFPGYDVLGEISRSNARVLKARHVATGDIVAIKHFSLNTDADTLRRFERESAIMTQMEHPSIVKVREVRLDADLPFIVMDYVEGGSVRQLIKEAGSLPVELTIRLGLQMVSAFRMIHAQGIVHRDVKPENILYRRLASGELHFLLTDFGVARLHEQPVTMTGQSLMTYEYAAPEQFDNPRQVSEMADYYALGVVLYECLTGNVPFPMGGETGIVTFMNAVMHNPPPPPVLPANLPLPGSLETLLEQLLAKQPAERLHNPDAVKLFLKQAEVEQLHRETGQTPIPALKRTEAFRAATPPVSERPVVDTKPTRQATINEPVASVPDRRRVLSMIVLGIALLLTGVWAYRYFTQDSRLSAPASPTGSATATKPVDLNGNGVIETTEMTDLTVPPAVRKAEELRQKQAQAEAARQRYEQEVASAINQLSATTFGGKVGFLGGVKGLNVRLQNPSSVAFKVVRVQVEYIKDNGETFKSPTMYFNNLSPGGSIVREAPDSKRGTRFRARVLRADAAPRPDSIAHSILQNP